MCRDLLWTLGCVRIALKHDGDRLVTRDVHAPEAWTTPPETPPRSGYHISSLAANSRTGQPFRLTTSTLDARCPLSRFHGDDLQTFSRTVAQFFAALPLTYVSQQGSASHRSVVRGGCIATNGVSRQGDVATMDDLAVTRNHFNDRGFPPTRPRRGVYDTT